MKIKTVYKCTNCGYKSPKWAGKCPDCGEWNTFEEAEEAKNNGKVAKAVSKQPVSRLSEVETGNDQRLLTGITEFDRVMGGGIVRDSVTIITSPPGGGKSTLSLMAAAALAELFEMGIDQIEYAAEVAMEHHLGLTCDPVCGLVQIPCIERNAVAAMRAINALSLANFLFASRKVSFDVVVETMYQTGKDLSHLYRETSEGGLAKLYENK